MRLFSTNSPTELVDLRTAVLKGLPDDNGLYLPERIPELPAAFLRQLNTYSFPELSYLVAKRLLQGALPDSVLEELVHEAVNFPAPLVTLDARLHVLELFHGPSMAFKDFGARFMARLMGYFNRNEDRELIILVATSGDTGGAVAAGFHRTPGIRVVILYPDGGVSAVQEKQLTTLGDNVTALRVAGTFDDCQRLVKTAFLDPELTQQLRLSSANSINISRLIPQSFYYFEGFKQLSDRSKPVSFSIPSGNFGNLTAGILAKRMGLPIHKFIAATNANDVVPQYLSTGVYQPRTSVRTLSNAMDVGAPSNFVRMQHLYGSTWNMLKRDIVGYAYTDAQTEDQMRATFREYDYVLDPHAAVGVLAAEAFASSNDDQVVVLETAHPGKFQRDVERVVETSLRLPEQLERVLHQPGVDHPTTAEFAPFKAWLLENY